MSETRESRAQILAQYGTIARAIDAGALSQFQDISVSEAIVLGLYNQGVRKYIGVFGHGTTDIANVLRVYEAHGLVQMYNVRNETAAAHAVSALKWQTGETAAVITSIGPGAMHAFAGSLCAASNGLGVYHIYGDETTQDEGFNMQQIPKHAQGLFQKLCDVMGSAYALYEPKAIFAALRRGAIHVNAHGFNGPFYLLAPMNVQPVVIAQCNLLAFPAAFVATPVTCGDDTVYQQATDMACSAQRITIKLGNGARGCGTEIVELANLLDAAIVTGAGSSGIVPASEPRNMSVGGSKGSISGNYCMNHCDLAIVIGARAVCQWDSSGTAWKEASGFINFNTDPQDAGHYNGSLPIVGDAKLNLQQWIRHLKAQGVHPADFSSTWARTITGKRMEWENSKALRYATPTLFDSVWGREVLTQPFAIHAACEFADAHGIAKFFDAGDVQANGFQIVADEQEGQTVSDTGSSYMGFGVSALLANVLRDDHPYAMAFSGDGSFTMNPQILIDGVEHGVRGCILVFDNRRMAAITGLQQAQYGEEYKTNDAVAIDYVAWGNAIQGVHGIFAGTTPEEFTAALEAAYAYDGLSLLHIPVYYGPDDLGNLGVYGDWNVGNWCARVQEEHHQLGV